METATTFYQQGDLTRAIAVAAEALKKDPLDLPKRGFMAEMFCILGDFEKADKQLEIMSTLEPKTAVTVATWRQLIRAATLRRDVYAGRATPEVIAEPTPTIAGLLSAVLSLREGDPSAARATLADLEAQRPATPMLVNGKQVDDLRDVDDLSAGIVEVLAGNGKYFWIDMSQVVSLAFEAPQRPLDLIWRKATLVLTNGSEGEVFLPCTYCMGSEESDYLLGRKTDWVEQDGLLRGIGQRLWLAGDEALPLMEIEHLEPMPAPVVAKMH